MGLIDRAESVARRARVDEPHVHALNDLVRRWRVGPGGPRDVPWIDPGGAGVAARVLLLMESPGPRTRAAGDLGFTSVDNGDGTSRNLAACLTRSGLDPAWCLRSNAVPWAVLDQQGHRRALRVTDLDEARPMMTALLENLPVLRVVVTFGTHALTAWMRWLTLTEDARVLPTLAVPHPSPANGHRRHEATERTVRAFRAARELAEVRSCR